MTNLSEEIARRWENGNFIEYLERLPVPSLNRGRVYYESYMTAWIIREGLVGELFIKFPAGYVEGERLHLHPKSDRIVSIISGGGQFKAERNGELMEHELVPGMRVWMPRGTLHTFETGPEGLLVHSMHLPFIPLDDPTCLVYPDTE